MNYDPHHLAMLAGVNKRPDYGLVHSTIKSRLGSVVDLQEGKEMEMIRSDIGEKLRQLVGSHIHALHNFFRESDPHDTGSVDCEYTLSVADSSGTAHLLPRVYFSKTVSSCP